MLGGQRRREKLKLDADGSTIYDTVSRVASEEEEGKAAVCVKVRTSLILTCTPPSLYGNSSQSNHTKDKVGDNHRRSHTHKHTQTNTDTITLLLQERIAVYLACVCVWLLALLSLHTDTSNRRVSLFRL